MTAPTAPTAPTASPAANTLADRRLGDSLTNELVDAIGWAAVQLGAVGEFTIDHVIGLFDDGDVANKSHRQKVSDALGRFARDPQSPIVRVGHSRSGRYRIVQTGEDLARAKVAQPSVAQLRTRRRSLGAAGRVASGTPDGVLTRTRRRDAGPVVGDHLEVLEARDNMIVVRCTDGRVYRSLLEPVL